MIKVINGYYVKSDKKQFIMGKLDEKGRLRSPRYFHTMKAAIQEAIRQALCEKVADEEITTLNGYYGQLKEAAEHIDRMIDDEPKLKERAGE